MCHARERGILLLAITHASGGAGLQLPTWRLYDVDHDDSCGGTYWMNIKPDRYLNIV